MQTLPFIEHLSLSLSSHETKTIDVTPFNNGNDFSNQTIFDDRHICVDVLKLFCIDCVRLSHEALFLPIQVILHKMNI